MKHTRDIMGMPITVEVLGKHASGRIESVFDYYKRVEERYSTYKPTSEVSQINKGLPSDQWSNEMWEILRLCEDTKQATHGYFDIMHHGKRDPSGLVKGWAIANAAKQLQELGAADFYIEAGGDIQAYGHNEDG